MASCVWCDRPYVRTLKLGDVTVCVCDVCAAQVAAVLAEPVQLPGRNDSCPECLENGVNVKMKKCKEHNDVETGLQLTMEEDGNQRSCCDVRVETEAGAADGTANAEGVVRNETPGV